MKRGSVVHSISREVLQSTGMDDKIALLKRRDSHT